MDREMNDKRYKEQLDRYITGNYGEDQFKDKDVEVLAIELYDAFVAKHKEVFAKSYEDAKFKPPEVTKLMFPPIWEELSTEMKQCWIAVAECAYQQS